MIAVPEAGEFLKLPSHEKICGNPMRRNGIKGCLLYTSGEEGYKLVWDDSMIFPNLTSADKVRVSTTQAVRGEILDRNGRVPVSYTHLHTRNDNVADTVTNEGTDVLYGQDFFYEELLGLRLSLIHIYTIRYKLKL